MRINTLIACHKKMSHTRQMIPQEAILTNCEVLGYRFRRRSLGPVETVYLLLIQVLHGNVACSGLRHLAGMTCSVNAYCSVRARLPVALFQSLLHWIYQSLREITDTAQRWHGHRVFLLDGSSFSTPDTPALQKAFGQPGGQKAGCGFPVAHLLAMFDVTTGMILDVFAAPLRTHEMSQVSVMHPQLRDGDVVVGGRGFCSYAHLALLSLRNPHAVFRIQQCMIVNFRPGRRHAHSKVGKSPKGLPRSKWLRCVGAGDRTDSIDRESTPHRTHRTSRGEAPAETIQTHERTPRPAT